VSLPVPHWPSSRKVRGRAVIDTIKKSTQILIDVIKEVGLEVNTENTKYMF
jgi:hypothetical protein